MIRQFEHFVLPRMEGGGMSKHELKIWPQYYARVKDGSKTFEVRKSDRDFKWGDDVWLHEWDPELKDYTPSPILRHKIGYVYKIPGTAMVVFSLLNQYLVMGES